MFRKRDKNVSTAVREKDQSEESVSNSALIHKAMSEFSDRLESEYVKALKDQKKFEIAKSDQIGKAKQGDN